MSHDTPLVIAHRTTMGHAPENTLLGIHQALDMRCDGVEVDVQLSSDGVPVLMHDDLLDRTTNGLGPVADVSLAELRALDAGAGESVPTLREALELINGRMLSVIELKIAAGVDVPALCEAVLEEIARADALSWSWLWSFDSEAVIVLAERAPHGRRIAHLCLTPTADIWQIAAEHRLDGISMHSTELTPSNVAACQAHEMAAFAWTVNEAADIRRCVDLGATGIVGDYPERIQAVIARDAGSSAG